MSVVFWIVARGDAANDFAVAPGQEKLSLAVLEERMLLAIEKFFTLDQQRRHPGRIVLVNAPGEFDERVAIRFRLDLCDFDLCHAQSCPERVAPASLCCSDAALSA